jgi:hypothetical protein
MPPENIDICKLWASDVEDSLFGNRPLILRGDLTQKFADEFFELVAELQRVEFRASFAD